MTRTQSDTTSARPRPQGLLAGLIGAHDNPPTLLTAELCAWFRDRDVADEALTAWEVRAGLIEASDAERAALVVVGALLEAAAAEGSTVIPVGARPVVAGLRAHLAEFEVPMDVDAVCAGLAGYVARTAALPSRQRLVGGSDERCPLVLQDGLLALHFVQADERSVRRALLHLCQSQQSQPNSGGASIGSAPGTAEIDAWPSAVAFAGAEPATLQQQPLLHGSEAVKLDAQQRLAVLQATQPGLSVVTGGPGTGKTLVITALVRMLAWAGVAPQAIHLAAPTGRAAKRLEEVLGAHLGHLAATSHQDAALLRDLPSPSTLHRLLGFRRNDATFKLGRHAPLSGKVLVIDEVSMVDLALMRAALEAVPRDRPFAVILVGDADQLPAVGTGDVLRDIVGDPTMASRVVRLATVFRQSNSSAGRQIVALAKHVLGEGAPSAEDAPALRLDVASLTFIGAELLPLEAKSRGALSALLDTYTARYLRPVADAIPKQGFVPTAPELADVVRKSAEARVLCLGYHGPFGVQNINAALAARLAKHRDPTSYRFPGAPVIVLENDPILGLYNGDIGLVVPVQTDDGIVLEAAFPSGTGVVRVGLGRLPRSSLAYATTVHKAQGSEAGTVLFFIDDHQPRLFTREALYTGITRAKGSIVVAGAVASMGTARRSNRRTLVSAATQMP